MPTNRLTVLLAFAISALGLPTAQIARAESLRDARGAFRTTLGATDYQPSGETLPPVYRAYRLVEYSSPAGNLAAYVSVDPKDGKKRPAVVWAHGGFGSIDPPDLRPHTAVNDQSPDAYRTAGFVVCYPSWRGENRNPGKFELYYGEVDDLMAAVEYTRKLPYVDANRVYLMGHSSGGALVLLAAEMGASVRAAVSFGGVFDPGADIAAGEGTYYKYKQLPFDWKNAQECRLRSATHFIGDLKVPTIYIEGQRVQSNVRAARAAEAKARAVNAPLSVHLVPGADHFDVLRPSNRVLIEKLKADTGERCNLALSDEELTRAFMATRDAKPEVQAKPFVRIAPEIAAGWKRDLDAATAKNPEFTSFMRCAITPDGNLYPFVDSAYDVGDRQCTAGGLTFVMSPAAYDTLAPLDVFFKQTDKGPRATFQGKAKID